MAFAPPIPTSLSRWKPSSASRSTPPLARSTAAPRRPPGARSRWSRRIRTIGMVAFASFAGVTSSATSPATARAEADATWEVKAELRGVEGKRGGTILCSVFDSDQGFPMDSSKAIATVTASGKGETRTCTFEVPGEGSYAISVLHDENGNKKVDTRVFGIPKEGWATSNNVKPRFRAPTFEESRFEVTTAATTKQLDMHY